MFWQCKLDMEKKRGEGEEVEAKTCLFPLLAASSANTQQNQTPPITTNAPSEWLCNTSFTTNLSVINDAVSSLHNLQPQLAADDDDDSDDGDYSNQVNLPPKSSASYELLEEEEGVREEKFSDSDSDSDRERKKKKKERKRKKRNKRKRRRDEDDLDSRKSNVRAWADSITKPIKDYYFDTHGDGDNLVYGSLYRSLFLSFFLLTINITQKFILQLLVIF